MSVFNAMSFIIRILFHLSCQSRLLNHLIHRTPDDQNASLLIHEKSYICRKIVFTFIISRNRRIPDPLTYCDI